MAVRYSDQGIEELIRERKPLPKDYLSLIQFKPKLGHRECDLDVKGDNGSDFRLILRQSKSNPLNFSVILGIIPVNTNQLFRLRRYNGKHGQHTNTIEKERFYDFHIHMATERYQEEPGQKEDSYAKITNRFADLHTALQCMLEDCNFDVPEDSQTSFL
jgi:hypothetical protein